MRTVDLAELRTEAPIRLFLRFGVLDCAAVAEFGLSMETGAWAEIVVLNLHV
jgi:hypothetical protein